jgi:hypothetical protein
MSCSSNLALSPGMRFVVDRSNEILQGIFLRGSRSRGVLWLYGHDCSLQDIIVVGDAEREGSGLSAKAGRHPSIETAKHAFLALAQIRAGQLVGYGTCCLAPNESFMQRHWTEKFMSPALVPMRSTLLQMPVGWLLRHLREGCRDLGLEPLGSSVDGASR